MDAQEVIIEGKTFRFVKRSRRGDVAIYTSGELFARVGEASKIKEMLALHHRFDGFGFPVPKIVGTGETSTGAYFTEESFGEKHFSELFRDDIQKNGEISEKLFDNFLGITEKFARAQLRSASSESRGLSLRDLVGPEDLVRELPELGYRIVKKYDDCVKALEVFPKVLTQGDFNSHNLFPTGVIDFEEVYYAPAGYDVVTNIFHISYFPTSREYEYFRWYSFSEKQTSLYYQRMDALYREAKLPSLSEYRKDFEYCRAVWLSARNRSSPKLREWRYELFKKEYFS